MGLLTDRWDSLEADFQRFYHLDLRHEVHVTGVRRMHVLIRGLPPEAAVWREDAFPPQVEMLATLIEQIDRWFAAQLQLTAGKKARVPAPARILRPGQEREDAPQRRIETDPRRIAAWFAKHAGRR